MLKVFTLLVFLLIDTSLFCQNSETLITEYNTNIEVKMNESFVIKTLRCSGPCYWYPDSFDTTIIKLRIDSLDLNKIENHRPGLKYDRWNFKIIKKGKYVVTFYRKEIGYKGELKPWIVAIEVK